MKTLKGNCLWKAQPTAVIKIAFQKFFGQYLHYIIIIYDFVLIFFLHNVISCFISLAFEMKHVPDHFLRLTWPYVFLTTCKFGLNNQITNVPDPIYTCIHHWLTVIRSVMLLIAGVNGAHLSVVDGHQVTKVSGSHLSRLNDNRRPPGQLSVRLIIWRGFRGVCHVLKRSLVTRRPVIHQLHNGTQELSMLRRSMLPLSLCQ